MEHCLLTVRNIKSSFLKQNPNLRKTIQPRKSSITLVTALIRRKYECKI